MKRLVNVECEINKRRIRKKRSFGKLVAGQSYAKTKINKKE